MTIGDVIAEANRGDIASRDINLYSVLKNKVLFRFFQGVGVTSWRRRYVTIPITVAAGRNYDLPVETFHLEELYLPSSASGRRPDPLIYIGEDPSAVARAEQSTTPGKPAAYWIVQGTKLDWKAIRLDKTPDQSYTATGSVIIYPKLTPDGNSEVDLSEWIPEPFHWTLVDGLRAEIYLDRYGIGDDRYSQAENAFNSGIVEAAEHKELARERFMVFAS